MFDEDDNKKMLEELKSIGLPSFNDEEEERKWFTDFLSSNADKSSIFKSPSKI